MTQSKGCFFQCGDPCTEEGDVYVSDILKHAPDQWNNFKDQALLWRGFDRFGEVYGTVDTKESDNNDIVLSEGKEEYDDIDIYDRSDEDSSNH